MLINLNALFLEGIRHLNKATAFFDVPVFTFHILFKEDFLAIDLNGVETLERTLVVVGDENHVICVNVRAAFEAHRI